VMWICIDRMRIRIHRIWSMRIQINRKYFSKHLSSFRSKKIFQFSSLNLNLKISSHQENVGNDVLLFRFRLENYKFYFLYNQECTPPVPIPTKMKKNRLLNSCFFLHFIPPYPDPQTEMNADPHHCFLKME